MKRYRCILFLVLLNSLHMVAWAFSPLDRLFVSGPSFAAYSTSSCSKNEQPVVMDRRQLFRSVLCGATAVTASANRMLLPAGAVIVEPTITTPTKPFASNEALLPAVRVKLTIDRAIHLANQLKKTTTSGTSSGEGQQQQQQQQQQSIMLELESLLLEPQNYTGSLQLRGVPSQPAKQYLESYRSMAGDLPFQRALIQKGDVGTWKALKRTEKEQERTNEVRAALNAYTDVLNFSGDSYVLNVDQQTKSNMVRQDQLPQLKQVITSDMGMRYLYRNQIITAMDNVRAEMKYQVSQQERDGVVDDTADLLELLIEAQKACDEWFSLIDSKDVRLAVETVMLEEKS